MRVIAPASVIWVLLASIVSARPVPGIAYEFRPLSDATPEEVADAKSEAAELSTERGWGDVLGGDSDLLDFAEDALEEATREVKAEPPAKALALEKDAALTFYAIGDWGAPGLQLSSVMRTVRRVRKAVPPMAMLLVGDNFYDVGVGSVRDRQWDTTFRAAFEGVPDPLLAVLGNHDHYTATSPAAQVEFSRRGLDKRWVMPDMNFSRTYPLPGSDRTVQLVFVDTTALALAHAVDEAHAKHDAGDIVAASLASLMGNSQDLAARAREQLAWLDATLAASPASFLVVVGHYPVYSGGDHGGAPELLRDVLPLLRRHRVDAYVSGHDHSLQLLSAHGVDFVVTGAASRLGTVRTVPHLRFGRAVPGFAALQFADDHMTVSLVDWTEAVVYQSVRKRRREEGAGGKGARGGKDSPKGRTRGGGKRRRTGTGRRADGARGGTEITGGEHAAAHGRPASAPPHRSKQARGAVPAAPASETRGPDAMQATVDDVVAAAMQQAGGTAGGGAGAGGSVLRARGRP